MLKILLLSTLLAAPQPDDYYFAYFVNTFVTVESPARAGMSKTVGIVITQGPMTFDEALAVAREIGSHGVCEITEGDADTPHHATCYPVSRVQRTEIVSPQD